ncbi:YciI-like protein [Nitzschia inconspicua]|uniref:YciI-like protein n=1 Tax=Nitzschia inconspicua TaxID=303405 RepID=A0A9K3PS99_9STRA|nr:YciI-like protein [Nitzschia inconspicua]KAG7357448.1 YciI-like protein [Nitzschia inconspicua]
MIGTTTALRRVSTLAFTAVSRLTMPYCVPSSFSSYSTSTALQATQYLLRYDYVPDVLEKRGPFREGHLGLAKQMIEEGTCLSGGPTGEVGMSVPTGALFIFTEETAAKAFVEGDPYVSNGIVTGHSIEEWNVVVQKE